MAVGEKAFDFSLSGSGGKSYSLSQFRGKIVVLEWFNKDCPFVKKHYTTGNMQLLQKVYREKGVVWLSIVSSTRGKQGYLSEEQASSVHVERGMHSHAILLDKTGDIGRAYGAKTTPHMFIIGKDGKLAYKGAIDDKPSTDSEDIKGSRNFVKESLDLLLRRKKLLISSTKAYGCSVKY